MFIALSKPEAPTVVTALEKHYAIFGKHPKLPGLDSAFDRDEVRLYTEEHNIFSGITVRSRPGAAGVYHADAFIRNDAGLLLCPAGMEMMHAGGACKNGANRYRAAGECGQCPDVNRRITEKRQQKGSPRRELWIRTAARQRAQRNRERSKSPEGKDIRRRRFSSESVFGHVNRFRNGDKAPYRNEEMDHIGQIMTAFCSNLEKLANHA